MKVTKINNTYQSQVNKTPCIQRVKKFFTSNFQGAKIKELLEAKVVVFDGRHNDYVRGNKVAYAAYDILSYGKNVITNWNDEVEKLTREGKSVRGFRDYNELFMMLLYGVFRK